MIQSSMIQGLVVALIFANFCLLIFETQNPPAEGSATEKTLYILDVCFNVAFTIELSCNLFAFWLIPFFNDPWMCFDLIVILTAWLEIVFSNLPGVKNLRMLRYLPKAHNVAALANFLLIHVFRSHSKI